MSTIISGAYKLHPNTDLFAFRRELLTLEPAMVRAAYQAVLSGAINEWDWAVSQEETVSLRDRLVEDFTRRNEYKQNPMRHTSAVVMQNRVRGELYVICYGSLREQREAILALPSVSGEFDYWDSADGPEDVTPEAWADRARAWDEAMDRGRDAVKMQGVTIHLLGLTQQHLTIRGCKDLLDELVQPSIEQRADLLAQQQYATDRDAMGDVEARESFHEFIRSFTEWRMHPEKVLNRETYLAAARKVITAQPSVYDELE